MRKNIIVANWKMNLNLDNAIPLVRSILDNLSLENQPEIINSSPYEDGWFYKISPSDLDELDNLLSPEDYSSVCED